jgi:hypothetical protein
MIGKNNGGIERDNKNEIILSVILRESSFGSQEKMRI